MADLYEIRRSNLRALIIKHGNGEIARVAGYPTPSYLSQMVGAKAKRGITEKTARRIEEALMLPMYWLNQERDEYSNLLPNDLENNKASLQNTQSNSEPISNPSAYDTERFNLCAEIVQGAVCNLEVNISHFKFAKILWMVFLNKSNDEDELATFANDLIRIAS